MGLPQLLAHELFHIFSRNNPDGRDKLYEVLRFERCNTIKVPAELRHVRITNPDAPCCSHMLRLRLDGDRQVCVTPILYSADDFDFEGSKTFFDYMKFRL